MTGWGDCYSELYYANESTLKEIEESEAFLELLRLEQRDERRESLLRQ